MIPPFPVLLRRALLVAAMLGIAWAIELAFFGGFALERAGWRLSSREPVRPLVVSAIAAVWYLVLHKQHWREDMAALSRVPSPRIVAAAAALAAFVVGVHWGTFVAGGQDSSGYVSQAERWMRGELTMTAPAWVDHAQWRDPTSSSAPLGYQGIEGTRRIVPMYAPGLPLMMAAFQALGGRQAVYYVVPLLGAVAVWATYLVGASLGGRWTGAMASVLLVSSPVFLWQVVQPMSDVPAAALWTLAVLAACRPSVAGALAAGAAGSLAILTRPNLVPLSGVVVLMVLTTPGDGGARARRALTCTFTVAIAAGAISVLNWYWYGSPLRSGYGSLDELYSIDRVWLNLKMYGSWLLQTQTPFPLLAIGAPLLFRGTTAGSLVRVALVTLVFPLAVLALYLPYFVFDGWWFLRFLLPAYPVLLGGASAVMVVGLRPRLGRAQFAGPVIAYVTLTLATHGVDLARRQRTFDLGDFERRYLQAADYAKRLPRPSVLVGMQHTGSLRYYTDHDVLRWDVVEPGGLDAAVGYLRGLGYAVYLVVDRYEAGALQRAHGGTATLRGLERLTPVRLSGGVAVYPLAGTGQPPDAARFLGSARRTGMPRAPE